MKPSSEKRDPKTGEWNDHEHVADPVNLEAQRSQEGSSSPEEVTDAAGNEELAKHAQRTVQRRNTEREPRVSPSTSRSSQDPISKSLRRPKAEE